MDSENNTCIICLEELSKNDILECGHKIHLTCAEKHFKPECPVCRKTLNIKVKGEKPKPNEDLDMDLIRRIQIEEERENLNNILFNQLFYIILNGGIMNNLYEE